jgi:hypothetical protein
MENTGVVLCALFFHLLIMLDTHTYDDPFVLDPKIRSRWAFMETSSAAVLITQDRVKLKQLAEKLWFSLSGNPSRRPA